MTDVQRTRLTALERDRARGSSAGPDLPGARVHEEPVTLQVNRTDEKSG